MATVALNTINAFDATKNTTISFRYTGVQVSANELIIYDNSNNNEVYRRKISSMTLSHPIPANSLENGNKYYAVIIAYFIEGGTEHSVTSSESNVFPTLTAATWELNITDGQTIYSASYDVILTYLQAEGEPLNEFEVDVYTSSKTLFWTSGILYDPNEGVFISGLVDGELYYIRAYGKTINGYSVDTRTDDGDDISFYISYAAPGLYALASLSQNTYGGWVQVSTNIASIEGRSLDGNYVSVYVV